MFIMVCTGDALFYLMNHILKKLYDLFQTRMWIILLYAKMHTRKVAGKGSKYIMNFCDHTITKLNARYNLGVQCI